MKRLTLALPVLAATAALLGGCVTANPDVVQHYHAQHMSTVHDATILTMRPVTIDGQQTGAGAFTGSVIGGIAGSSAGYPGSAESAVVAMLGAVVGAVVGNAIERDATKENAYEILVQLRNGERRSIIQAQGSEPLSPGDAVILVTSAGRTRVMRAPGVSTASAAPLPPPVASPSPPPPPMPAQGASAPIYTPR